MLLYINLKEPYCFITVGFLIVDFSQLSTQRVRNKKLPAMRVGNNRLYQKITTVL